MSLRRSRRSTSTPANGPNSTEGSRRASMTPGHGQAAQRAAPPLVGHQRRDGDEPDPVAQRRDEHGPPQAGERRVGQEVLERRGLGPAERGDLLGYRGHGSALAPAQAPPRPVAAAGFRRLRGCRLRSRSAPPGRPNRRASPAASGPGPWPRPRGAPRRPRPTPVPHAMHRVPRPEPRRPSPAQSGHGSGMRLLIHGEVALGVAARTSRTNRTVPSARPARPCRTPGT